MIPYLELHILIYVIIYIRYSILYLEYLALYVTQHTYLLTQDTLFLTKQPLTKMCVSALGLFQVFGKQNKTHVESQAKP